MPTLNGSSTSSCVIRVRKNSRPYCHLPGSKRDRPPHRSRPNRLHRCQSHQTSGQNARGAMLGAYTSLLVRGMALGQATGSGRETARRFWREVVQGKEREGWQIQQWTEAMRWFLKWLEIASRDGRDHRSLPERVRDAVESAGARRGLALRTRRCYGSWMARFASICVHSRFPI